MTGLVSISFRNLSPKDIIEITKAAGLDGLEWGGDVHVPHGDIKTAEQVRKMTFDAGLSVFSYGSYYHVGTYENPMQEWEKVVAVAKALTAPIIRVWAYNKPSKEVTEEEYNQVVEETKQMCKVADGISVCFECHGGTLTDDYHSSLALMKDIKTAYMYWQPNQQYDKDYNIASLRTLLPYITNIHTFHWDAHNRYPLKDGIEIWREYIDITKTSGRKHHFLLEFMFDNEPKSLLQESQTLKELLS